MTTFQIKIIAVAAMVIDHVGLFFFPQIVVLRIIGRLSFPLFAWLIANGATHTRDINKYLLRLLTLALLSQIPFLLASYKIDQNLWHFNVLFTLFFGLVAIKYTSDTKNKLRWFIISLLCTFATLLLNADYGASGVASIVFFYVFFSNFKLAFISQAIITLAPAIFYSVFYRSNLLEISLSQLWYFQLAALLPLIVIYFYNSREGHKTYLWLYWFYFIQYLIILLIYYIHISYLAS